MAWIDVGERLPELDQRVPVFGAYTPIDPETGRVIGGAPRASRRACGSGGCWSSDPWRGTAGIESWWDEAVGNGGERLTEFK